MSFWSAIGSIWTFLFQFPISVLAKWTVFLTKLTAFTLSQTVTLDFYSLSALTLIAGLSIWLIIRYRFLNRYTRLPLPIKKQSPPFDLHPDTALDDELYGEGRGSYGDEFMGAFLSSIKVFGYLDR